MITAIGTMGGYFFYVKDYQGNVRVVLNQSNQPVELNSYYPYGGLMGATTSEGTQPYKYSAKELDRENGIDLYDSNARWYDSMLGRTTTPDPLAEKYYNMSPYAYCAGNPVKFVDPTGMFTQENIIPFATHPVIAVFPSSYANNSAIKSDHDAVANFLPILLVDNVRDFADAMNHLDFEGIQNSVITINSHGKDGTFSVGDEVVDAYTDFSSLQRGFSGKTIFLGACNTTKGYFGEAMIQNLSEQTNSTVIGSSHPINAGYLYDGSLGLNETVQVPYALSEQANEYKISTSGNAPYIIHNVRITTSHITWDYKMPFFSTNQ